MSIVSVKELTQKLLRKAFVWLGVIDKPDLRSRFSEVYPANENVRDGEIIVVGTTNFNKWACFRCPGACGEIISLYLGKSRRPRWRIQTDRHGRITIHPSVRQTNECGCHFWVRRGKVEWCADTPRLISGLDGISD